PKEITAPDLFDGDDDLDEGDSDERSN
ncbi:MAG: hypothetical protein RL288_661, partial [Actinomycetota bacterium]